MKKLSKQPRIFHRRAGALEYAVGLGDLLVDAGKLLTVAAATTSLRGDEVLLQLHAADLVFA